MYAVVRGSSRIDTGRSFGCFFFDPPDTSGVLRIHLVPPETTSKSLLASANTGARVQELRELFSHVRYKEPADSSFAASPGSTTLRLTAVCFFCLSASKRPSSKIFDRLDLKIPRRTFCAPPDSFSWRPFDSLANGRASSSCEATVEVVARLARPRNAHRDSLESSAAFHSSNQNARRLCQADPPVSQLLQDSSPAHPGTPSVLVQVALACNQLGLPFPLPAEHESSQALAPSRLLLSIRRPCVVCISYIHSVSRRGFKHLLLCAPVFAEPPSVWLIYGEFFDFKKQDRSTFDVEADVIRFASEVLDVFRLSGWRRNT